MTDHNDRPMILLPKPDTVQPVLGWSHRAKHLKKRRGRKLFRLGVSCLSMLVITALLSVGGTFSKYTTSGGTEEALSIQTGTFASSGEDITDTVRTNKTPYGLADTDVVVAAFTIRNSNAGKTSVVDLNVDVNLIGLSGQYTAQAQFSGSTLEFQTEEMAKNAKFVSALKSSLKVGTLEDGVFTPLEQQPTPTAITYSEDNSLENPEYGIMPAAFTPFPFVADCSNHWNNAFTILSTDSRTYVGIIIIDTNITDVEYGKLTYTGPDLLLNAGNQNLVVTVNQARTGD